MKFHFLILIFSLSSLHCLAQVQVGDKWFDNNLSLMIVEDQIRSKGIFSYCVVDTSYNYCVENLSTGVEVEVYGAGGKLMWEGFGSGRLTKLALDKAYPDAEHIIVRAFKPFVINKSSGNRIYQDKRIEIKYEIK